RREPQHAAAPALRRLELEDRLERIGAGAHDGTGRRAAGIDGETGRPRPLHPRHQSIHDRIGTTQRVDVPAQCQHIAPMAVGVEQALERSDIAAGQSLLEPGKPVRYMLVFSWRTDVLHHTTGLAPPSTLMATPVMNEPASEHRKQAMRANSSALPMRPSGMRPAMPFRNSS